MTPLLLGYTRGRQEGDGGTFPPPPPLPGGVTPLFYAIQLAHLTRPRGDHFLCPGGLRYVQSRSSASY